MYNKILNRIAAQKSLDITIYPLIHIIIAMSVVSILVYASLFDNTKTQLKH